MLLKKIEQQNSIKTTECKNCGDLFAIIFTEENDGVYRCHGCKRILSQEETKEAHIAAHHMTCSFRCKSILCAEVSWSYAKNNKGRIGIIAGSVAAPALLPVVGFTAAGVAGGSVAAGVQSAVYGAYTTGVFSVLQSAGTGAIAANAAVIAGGGTLGGLVGKGVGAVTKGNGNSSSNGVTNGDNLPKESDGTESNESHECKYEQ